MEAFRILVTHIYFLYFAGQLPIKIDIAIGSLAEEKVCVTANI